MDCRSTPHETFDGRSVARRSERSHEVRPKRDELAGTGAILCSEQDLSHLAITGGSSASIYCSDQIRCRLCSSFPRLFGELRDTLPERHVGGSADKNIECRDCRRSAC